MLLYVNILSVRNTEYPSIKKNYIGTRLNLLIFYEKNTAGSQAPSLSNTLQYILPWWEPSVDATLGHSTSNSQNSFLSSLNIYVAFNTFWKAVCLPQIKYQVVS